MTHKSLPDAGGCSYSMLYHHYPVGARLQTSFASFAESPDGLNFRFAVKFKTLLGKTESEHCHLCRLCLRDAHFFLSRFDCVCQCQRPQSMLCVNLAVATWFWAFRLYRRFHADVIAPPVPPLLTPTRPARLHVDENFSQAPDISHKNHFLAKKLFRSFLFAPRCYHKNISIFVSSHPRVLGARNFISFFRAKCRLFIIPRRKRGNVLQPLMSSNVST